MTCDSADPLIGVVAGPFRLLRKVGEGGMGAVYYAERIADFEQQAAVKLLLEGHGDKEVAARFHAEQQVLAALNHPNIVRLLDAGTIEGGIPYIAMEYVEGEPLDQYCDRTGPSLDQRLRLVMAMLDALDYAHRRFLAHCDLKYSNVLVDTNGAVHLLDFGIAKLLNLSHYGIEDPLTRHFRPFTPEFASPEQLLGRPLTAATDVYTTGVLLYSLLSGEHPFEEIVMQPLTLLKHICSVDPEPLSHRARRRKTAQNFSQPLDEDLDAIAAKALRKDPDDRYRSAAEFKDDLQRYLDNLPVHARQGSLRYLVSKFVRRNTGLAVAGLALVIALLAGATGTVWEAVRARNERTRAEARFKDVRKLANALLATYHEKVKSLPGSTNAQQLLVTKSLGYLESLAAQGGLNRELAAEISGGYARLAAIQGSPYENNLGQPAEALLTLEKAVALAKPVAVQLPADFEAFHSLAQAQDIRGDVLFSMGQAKEAAASSQIAAGIYEQLIKVRPQDADLLMEASGSHEGLGDKLGSGGLSSLMDTDGAIRHLNRAREISAMAASVAPKMLRPRRGAALLYMKIADITWESDQQAALELYAKSKAALDRLMPEEQSQYATRRVRTFVLRHNGDALLELGRNEEALKRYEECRSIVESDYAMDSGNSRAQWDISVLLHSLAAALQPLGRHREAISYLEKLKTMIASMRGMQTSTRLQNTFGEALLMQAVSKQALGDSAGAEESARQGLAIYDKLATNPDLSPQNLVSIGGTLLTLQPAHLQDPKRALQALGLATKNGAAGPPLTKAVYIQALLRNGETAKARELANALLLEIAGTKGNSWSYHKTRKKLDEILRANP